MTLLCAVELCAVVLCAVCCVLGTGTGHGAVQGELGRPAGAGPWVQVLPSLVGSGAMRGAFERLWVVE